MKIKTPFMLIAAIVLSACGSAQGPGATATRVPDRIGTRVAEEQAIAATLTAAASTPNPTATAMATPADTPQVRAPSTQIPATSTLLPLPTRQLRTATPNLPQATLTTTPQLTATPQPTTAPQSTATPQPTTAPIATQPEAEVYAIIVAGGNLGGLDGSLVLPGQSGQIKDSPVKFSDRMNVRMRVWDPAAGVNDGDGIESVDFTIRVKNDNDDGEVVFKRRETTQAYCLFGSDSVNCQSFIFARSDFTWPRSEVLPQRMKNGVYRLQAVINRKSGEPGRWGFNFELSEIPIAGVDPAVAQVIIAIIDPPVNSIVTKRLVFQVTTFFTGSGNKDGDGIDKVKLEIIDAGGAVVYERTEVNKPYCAFQDTNGRCNAWVFAEHSNTWQNNTPIVSGAYTLRATSFSKTGVSAFTSIGIQIQLP